MTDILDFEDEVSPAAVIEVAPAPELEADQADLIDWDDVPPAGTACAGCKSLGHWCAAKCYRAIDSPLCVACANGIDCAVVLARLKREEPRWMAEITPEKFDTPAGPVRNVTPLDPAKRVVIDAPVEVRRNWRGMAIGTGSAPLVNASDVETIHHVPRRQK
jgi:hypothetical protein